MLGRLGDIANKAKKGISFYDFMQQLVDNEEVKELIVYLNTVNQLYIKGVDSKGTLLSEIGGNYSDFTLKTKEGKRPKNEAWLIDLKDTGDFYRSFIAIAESKGVVIQADTIKDGEDLQSRWGTEILGLTDASLKVLKIDLSMRIREELRKLILA